jgi:hypothetical protein
VLFASAQALRRLTPAQRAILPRAAAASIAPTATASLSADRYDTSVLCAHGRVRFVAAGPRRIAALRRAVEPVYAALERDAATRRAIAAIEALRARLHAPASTIPRCPPARDPEGAQADAAAVDGVYSLTVPAQALAQPQRIPEAYGSWQIVLDRGRFRLTERSDAASWIADGQVDVRGDRMVWTIDHYGSMGAAGTPDGDPVGVGERLRLGWRRSGAALVLATDRATPVLAALGAQPLERVQDAPSRQRLENPAALDGIWAGDATAADVIAHHDDPSGISGNTGPLRLRIHDGRFRWTQRTPEGLHWGVGASRFAGDTLELRQARTDDNLSPAPIFLRWSVYHRRLTFRAAPGFSPEAWAYEPWRRVG